MLSGAGVSLETNKNLSKWTSLLSIFVFISHFCSVAHNIPLTSFSCNPKT
jgi:hypothetical protein